MPETQRPIIKPLGIPKHVRMAVVAASGFGKTVFCGTAPKALFLTTDPEGTASAAAFGSTAQEIEVTNEDELNQAYLYLKNGGIKELGIENLIVDNLTEVQRNYMTRALELAVSRNPEKANRYVPSQHEYLIEQNAIVDCVKKINQLPVNVFWTVHRVGMEDGGGNDYYSAAIRGKAGEIAQTCLGYMNLVGMGEVVTVRNEAGELETVRRMYFDHVDKFRGKDRFVKLGDYMDELTIPDLLGLLYPDGQDFTGPVTPATVHVAPKTAAPVLPPRRPAR